MGDHIDNEIPLAAAYNSYRKGVYDSSIVEADIISHLEEVTSFIVTLTAVKAVSMYSEMRIESLFWIQGI